MEHKCSKEQIIEDLKQLTYKQDTQIAVLESKYNAVTEDIKKVDQKVDTINIKMEKEFKAINNKEIAILVFIVVTLIGVILSLFGVKV
jgi:tetrahydromethanopterin S-methyltransferase subunit G